MLRRHALETLLDGGLQRGQAVDKAAPGLGVIAHDFGCEDAVESGEILAVNGERIEPRDSADALNVVGRLSSGAGRGESSREREEWNWGNIGRVRDGVFGAVVFRVGEIGCGRRREG